MRYLMLIPMLFFASVAFAADVPASCEIAKENILSRTSSGIAQVGNLGGIQITCTTVPSRPFPSKPGDFRNGLRAITVAYQIADNGTKQVVPTVVQVSGGGFNDRSDAEFVTFALIIQLDPEELGAEERRYSQKMKGLMSLEQSKAITADVEKKALETFRDLVAQNRLGHFQVECRVMDGDRVLAVGVIELEVLFKGRFSDVAIPAAKPPSLESQQEPLGYFVKELHVDGSQHLVPNGPRSLVEPGEGIYYSVAHTGTGFTTVDHIEKKAGAAQAERLLYLETNTNQVLDRTVKDDEILTGPFGTVHVQKTCFFNRPVASGYSAVTVMVGSNNDLGRPEIPLQLSDAPEGIPPLTSLSLVRIFQNDSEYVVVSANYESSGELGSLNIGKTKGGEVLPGSGTSFHIDSKNPLLETYGIPLRIDVQEYLRSHRFPIRDVALHQDIVQVNQHYGFDKLIREDQLKDGAVVSSRYLRPSVTEEERTLDSECDSRFRQQQSMGLPTVE